MYKSKDIIIIIIIIRNLMMILIFQDKVKPIK